jgi:2-oxoglutarate ferredoxin oxidoreductase subunit delta
MAGGAAVSLVARGAHQEGRRRMRQRVPVLPEPLPVRGVVHLQVERCKGCQLCIEYCPTHVLALSAAFNAKGYHYPTVAADNCIACHACSTICPEYAIFATPSPRPPADADPFVDLAEGCTHGDS